MLGRLVRSLRRPDWKPGFHPVVSQILDVQREALGASSPSASHHAGSYRDAAHPHPESVPLGAVTSLVYTTLLVSFDGAEPRQEHSVRRMTITPDGSARLVWEHATAEKAFTGRWTGRVGDVIVSVDATRALRGIDVTSGEILWSRDDQLVLDPPLALPSGTLRSLVDGDRWLDLDPQSGEVVAEGRFESPEHAASLVRGLPSISGDAPWVETADGEVRAEPPDLVFESIDGQHRTISLAPWRTEGSLIRCGDTLVAWVHRAERDGGRAAALALVDVHRLERVGRIDLGPGSASLAPRSMSVCGRHVVVSAEFGHDADRDGTSSAMLVDIAARRVIAELRVSTRKSSFYDADGKTRARVEI